MTQKELLYVEDAIGHETTIVDVCNDIISHLDSEELISFIENEIRNHENIKNNLINALEAKSNG